MFVVDISENNGEIDWDAMWRAGVEGVIVRVGYGVDGTEDSKFRENASAALEHGMKVGGYWYSYALDEEGARKEADACYEIIRQWGGMMELPVWFDMEDADGYKVRHDFEFTKENITNICRAFIEQVSLDCGVYASYDWICKYIDWEDLGCAIWNAEWGEMDDFFGYGWQFTDSYNIGGKEFDGSIFRVW